MNLILSTSTYPIVDLDIAGNTVFEIEVDLSNYATYLI